MFLHESKQWLTSRYTLAALPGRARKYRLVILLALFMLTLGAGLMVYIHSAPVAWGMGLAVLCGLMAVFLYQDYIRPQKRLEKLILSLRAGFLHERLHCGDGGGINELCSELNFVVHMLESQSLHVAEQLQNHTRHMAEKNRLLTTLYQFTDALSAALSFSDFIAHMVKGLSEDFGVNRLIIRLNKSDGMHWLEGAGNVSREERVQCLPFNSPWLKTSEEERRLAVPLRYHDRLLGICCIYLDGSTFSRRNELGDLFASLGRYIAIAIERQRHEKEAQHFSIIKEREKLAYELHDSLAQTIHSISYCVRAVKSSLHEHDSPQVRASLDRLSFAATEANREVRVLISQFRTGGAIHKIGSISELVEHLKQQYPRVKIHFYKSWEDHHLPPEYEANIYKIVQEALFNAFKHSKADAVRVLMRHDEHGNYRVLIEDNGVGANLAKVRNGGAGEHVGISIMRSRAGSMGGDLRLESEPDEGVRVILRFTYPNKGRPG